VSDLGALREQPEVFGEVASTSTAWRVVEGISAEDLDGLREARRQARERAWRRGAGPREIVLDLDATLVLAHSEKEQAASNYKHGFGFHPVLCYLDESEEALAGILRRGNATANDSADNIEVLELALKQLPKSKRPRRILARADSSGATHAFIDRLREHGIQFSVGMDFYEAVKEAILNTPEVSWLPAITQEGDQREGAWVCELSQLELSSWPSGTRAICRRERPHPGAQLKFTDHQGFRFQVFITDQTDADIAILEARHRGHADIPARRAAAALRRERGGADAPADRRPR